MFCLHNERTFDIVPLHTLEGIVVLRSTSKRRNSFRISTSTCIVVVGFGGGGGGGRGGGGGLISSGRP